MARELIPEFDGIGREAYDAVNGKLDIDSTRSTGNWPPGMLFHAGSSKPGGWVVFEVWGSKQAHASFKNERLGRALREGGVKEPPSRVEWLDLAAHIVPK
jgi:hypothetical protein